MSTIPVSAPYWQTLDGHRVLLMYRGVGARVVRVDCSCGKPMERGRYGKLWTCPAGHSFRPKMQERTLVQPSADFSVDTPTDGG